MNVEETAKTEESVAPPTQLHLSSIRSLCVVVKMHSLSALVLLGASLVSTTHAIGPDCVNGPLKTNKICDVTASPAERAAALVEVMETQEKLDNLVR